METSITTENQILENIFSTEVQKQLISSWSRTKLEETARSLPTTELGVAGELAPFLTGKAVYVKAEASWYVWDGIEYRKTEGDWFIHKTIKQVANIYGGILEGVTKQIGLLKRTATGDDDQSGLFTQHFSMNMKLHSASSLDALSKILKSELDEIPVGITKDTPFLTTAYLAERVALPHLVQDHIPSVGIGQLYGQSSAGKTIAVVDLALSICAGLDKWQGLPLNTKGPSHVLYIAAEGGQPFWDMVEAWKAKHPGADTSGFLAWDAGVGQTLTIGTSLDVAPGLFGLEAMRSKVKGAGINPSLVVFDPQANILSGVDENSNVDMVAALKPIQDWATEGQFLALLVHHEGKKDSGSGRGASAQKAMMDLLIKLTKNATGTRTLSFEKVKGSKDPDKKLNYTIETVLFSGGSGSGGVAVPDGAQLSTKERAERLGVLDVSRVRRAIQDGATSAQGIALATGINRNTVGDHLKTLEAQGVIQNLGSDTRPKWMIVSPDYSSHQTA
ncbi:AAA family ATPase [Arthrobacter sp. ISL-28]|uniref:AAA family ATPase n=1 Tax=Arthrobacter sp. ISL-28 TaxID=2819108 RepID=UPI001BEAB093|nr:AAA family ATPase [Arthrobacter sp. ISL-28]MBT2522767.1 AAA family ATPase [Arthrobacter sp. ISL-28]